MRLTKTAWWLVSKFLTDGVNHVVSVTSPLGKGRRWFVNGQFIGDVGDDPNSVNYFPFVMPADWLAELHEIQSGSLHEGASGKMNMNLTPGDPSESE